MRRKIISATPQRLLESGLPCASCVRWEESLTGGNLKADETQRIEAKTQHLRHIIDEWGEFGKLIFVEHEAVAYAQYGPAQLYPASSNMPVGPVSDDAVLLACLYVMPFAQGRGLGRVLLQSIEAGLVRRKMKAIEVFATRDSNYPPGPIEFYLQNGFYIIREHPTTPLLRLELKALVGWHINVQFALDRLKIPAAARIGVPTA